MRDEAAEPDGAVTETPPIELLEKAVADMLDGEDIGAAYWDRTLRGFRKALDAARRENVWDVVDLAFGNIVSVAFEMLVRSQLAMRLRMESLAQRRGAEHFPDIREDAERTERVARFIMETSVQYTKVRHVSSLVRRRDNPKILDFEEARERVAGREGSHERGTKKVEGAEA